MLEKLRFKNKSEVRAELDSYLTDVRKTKQDLEKLFDLTKNINGVYEPFNEAFPVNDDKSVWSFDYFLGECSTLSLIFTKERVLHLMEVREYLRNNGCEKLIEGRFKNDYVKELEEVDNNSNLTDKNVSNNKTIVISRSEFIRLYPNLQDRHYTCKSFTDGNGNNVIIKENNRVTRKTRFNK